MEKIMARGLTLVALAWFAVDALAADGPQVAPAEPADMKSLR
jgi:hypothetical protein